MRKWSIKFCLILVLLFSGFLFFLGSAGAQAGICSNPELGGLPVLADGRVKPLTVHAGESLKTITGKSKRSRATEIFCKLSFSQPYDISLRVDHVELREVLSLAEGQKTIAIEEVQSQQNDLNSRMHQLIAEKKDKKSYGKALTALLHSVRVYDEIVYGKSWTVPIDHTGSENDWITLTDYRAQEVMGNPEEVLASIQEAGRKYLQKVPSTVNLEMTYHKMNLISYKVLISLLALIIVFAMQKKSLPTQYKVGGIAIALVLSFGITDIIFRIMISSRGPVTNMYETVLWVGMGVALFAGILAFVKKEPVYFLFGLLGILLANFMNRFAPSMVDPSIQPLVPVLRDNFWLSTHVTTVTISYAAFALSWLIGNYFMLRTIFRGEDSRKTKDWMDLAYAAIKIGVVLLAAGVILGGVWADYSWGRFWGWDPKETWSLIALLLYVAILHGRYTGWIPPQTFLPAISLAFLSILMCWFGVNYILAAGLHSYGFSENGTIFLASLFGLQFFIFALYWFRKKVSQTV